MIRYCRCPQKSAGSPKSYRLFIHFSNPFPISLCQPPPHWGRACSSSGFFPAHGRYVPDDTAAITVGMIPVPFLGDEHGSALSRPAALTGIVSGAVSAPILIHLRRRDRADLRIEINTPRISVVHFSVPCDIAPRPLSASALRNQPAPLRPPHPGMSAVASLHGKIGKCYDADEGADPAVDYDLHPVPLGHDL